MRFARRLINWLTATTGSGVLFDVDMRLRPNGESGMLVSSVDSFEKYQKNEDGTGAWLWEHQALTRARYAAATEISVTNSKKFASKYSVARETPGKRRPRCSKCASVCTTVTPTNGAF